LLRRPALLLAVAAFALAPLGAHAGLLGCSVPTVNDRCESWAAVYDDPSIAQGSDQLEPRIAASPDGKRVFVAAIDEALNSSDPYDSPASWVVLSYDGQSGAQLWSSTYQSEGHYDRPNDITVSPDGRFVYVTGASYDAPVLIADDRDLVTIAYDADTGQQLWRARNLDPNVHDAGVNVITSRDGSQVYAAVNIEQGGGEIDWAAVAYDAADGSVLWRTTYAGVTPGVINSPQGIALSPDGGLLYITGESGGTAQFDVDYATAAYATRGVTPGASVWVSRYDGVGHQYPDRAAGIAVDAEGRVIVTGDSISNFTTSVQDDFATVAYDGATGAELWASRYSGPAGGVNFGMAVAAGWTADIAVVTGQIEPNGRSGDTAWATLGYDTITGQQLWTRIFDTTGYSSQFPVAVALTPDGTSAVVTGFSGGRAATPVGSPAPGGEAVTIAYAPSDGSQQWVARYTANLSDTDTPRALATSIGGGVFTAVQIGHNLRLPTDNSGDQYDVVTLAYLPPVEPPESVPEGPPVWYPLLGAAGLVGAWERTRRRSIARGVTAPRR
jgi:sugar lactone lactonase YvrE